MEMVESFFDLPWEDIICKQILRYLTINEVYQLKRVCKSFDALTSLYMGSFCRCFDLTPVGKHKKFSGEIFLKITENKRNLLALNLLNCKGWVKDEHVIPLLQNNEDMTFLCTSDCYDLTDKTFTTIAHSLLKLSSLDLSFCRELSDSALGLIGHQLHTLRLLDVSGCWCVKDDSLMAIAVNNPSLETVKTRLCYGLTDISIVTLAKNCHQIRLVDICGCWRVKDQSVIALREYCKKLEKLFVKDCAYITEVSLARLRPMGVVLDVEKPVYRGIAGIPFTAKMPLLQI